MGGLAQCSEGDEGVWTYRRSNNPVVDLFKKKHRICHITWIYPPPRITVTNEGLGWDSLLKM